MRYRKKNDIIDFFDLSILILINNKTIIFERTLLKNASFFERNGIEVVVLLINSQEEKELLKLIEQYPFINFKIIINKKKITNKIFEKILNSGIKQAFFKYILFLDSEVEFVTDIIYQLRYIISYYPKTYVTDAINSINFTDNIYKYKNSNSLNHNCIMAEKMDLIKIKGFEDDNCSWKYMQMVKRLELNGLRKMELLEIKLVRIENRLSNHQLQSSGSSKTTIRCLKNVFYPKKAILNSKSWDQHPERILWNWETQKNYFHLKKYISLFKKSYILNKKICTNEYDIIALIQIRNESKNISKLLSHLDEYCDGIILLDDGSMDDSYGLALHDKLLVKMGKKYKGYFDDLENRNILLRMASFIKSKWFFFIDADERFDPRFSNIREYIHDEKADIYKFHLVDLWDNPNTYRADMPDRMNNGIGIRSRMFRSIGNLQIQSTREIHFPAIPYSKNIQLAQILILHYGNYDRKTREKKYNLYISQDSDGKKQGHSYDFLKDVNIKLKNLNEISTLQTNRI